MLVFDPAGHPRPFQDHRHGTVWPCVKPSGAVNGEDKSVASATIGRDLAIPASRAAWDSASSLRGDALPMRSDFRAPPSDFDAQESARERAAELARLVPLWPTEIADTSPAGRTRLVATLYRALKAERRRGAAGHWSYDLARHAALLAAWRRERAALSMRDAAAPCGAVNPRTKKASAR